MTTSKGFNKLITSGKEKRAFLIVFIQGKMTKLFKELKAELEEVLAYEKGKKLEYD